VAKPEQTNQTNQTNQTIRRSMPRGFEIDNAQARPSDFVRNRLVFRSNYNITILSIFADTKTCDETHDLFQEWRGGGNGESLQRLTSMARFLGSLTLPVNNMRVFPGHQKRNAVNTSHSVVLKVEKSKLSSHRLMHPLIQRANQVGVEVIVKRNSAQSLLVVCRMVCDIY